MATNQWGGLKLFGVVTALVWCMALRQAKLQGSNDMHSRPSW